MRSQAFDELDMMYGVADALESHLTNEAENGRLLKLMIKLGCINERPEYQMNPHWAETGDRYVLKLFRDYLFHQVRTVFGVGVPGVGCWVSVVSVWWLSVVGCSMSDVRCCNPPPSPPYTDPPRLYQVDENGEAVVDAGHIVNGLNKVDSNHDEKVVLSAPDQSSVLVASFSDVRRCVDESFHELCKSTSEGYVG